MKKLLMTAAFAFSIVSAYSHDDTNAISLAKASELSLHRVEKLVNLRSTIDGIKVDKAYINNMHTIEIEKNAHTALDEISFVATLSQFPGADGTRNQIELSLNAQGKTLVQHATLGTLATDAPVWSSKSPVDLLENALHYVIDNALVKPELKAFNEGVYKTTLKKVTKDGQEYALVEILSRDTQLALTILLDLEAKFLSYEIK